MIWVTENGSGLTLGWSGTPQFTKLFPSKKNSITISSCRAVGLYLGIANIESVQSV